MTAHERHKIIIDLNPGERQPGDGEVLERPKEARGSREAVDKYTAFGYAHGDTVVLPDRPHDVLGLVFEKGKVYLYRPGQPNPEQHRQSTRTPERYIPYRVGDAARAVEVYAQRLAVATTISEVLLLVESLARAGVNLSGVVGRFSQEHSSAMQLDRARARILNEGTEYLSRAHGLREKVEQLRGAKHNADAKVQAHAPVKRAVDVREGVVELTPAYLAVHTLPVRGSISVFDVREGRQREFIKLESESGGVFFRESFPIPKDGRSPLRIIEALEPEVIVALLEESGGRYVVEQPKRIGTGKLNAKELEKPAAVRVARMQAFRDMAPGDIVVIGQERYRKKVRGVWELENLTPYGTVVVRSKAELSDEAIMRMLDTRPNDPEYVKFMARSSEALPVVKESAAELRHVHEQFAKILLDLYPGVKTFKQGYVTRALDMMGLAGKQDIALSLRQEALNYFQSSQSEIAQGSWYGDCYLLAGHNAGKRTAPGLVFEQMARSIRPGKKRGEYEVKIPAMDKESPADMQQFFGERYRDGRLVVTYSDLEKVLPGWASADLGDLILEKAYAQFIVSIWVGEYPRLQAITSSILSP